ncbi:MAG: hypothetical protein K2M17_02770 [Bacilli bacterium]|nr:hypothetical protein [Bacilli bacterium]
METLIKKLSNSEIERYSKLFKQPVEIVKHFASVHDDLKEFQKALYEFDDEEIDKIDDSELEDDEESELDKIKKHIAKKYDLNQEEINNMKAFKIDKSLLFHICPFTEEQKKQIDCSFCPLNMNNFLPIMMELSIGLKIPINEAAESIKFKAYHCTEETFNEIKQLMIKNGNNN